MGYRGKVEQQARARELRLEGWSLVDIARELGVSKSSVSLWVRDLGVVIEQRRGSRAGRPTAAQRRKLDEIDALDAAGRDELGILDDQAFLAAGAALYAGEGAKQDGRVLFANSDPDMVRFFCQWLRYFFPLDEKRFRVRVYLHEGLDLDAAETFWSVLTNIPRTQFRAPYRAVPDPSIRRTKHLNGCVYVGYNCVTTHRAVMGLVRGFLSFEPTIRGSSAGRASDC